MKPVIRPFTDRDKPDLISTIDAVCAEGRWMRTLRFEPTPVWAHALENAGCSDHLLLVVEDDAQIVGWCRTFPTSCRDGATTASLGIGLLPTHRDQGNGTALVCASLEWAAGATLDQLTLMTRPDNQRAIHVFGKCGFSMTEKWCDGSVEMAVQLGRKSYANPK